MGNPATSSPSGTVKNSATALHPTADAMCTCGHTQSVHHSDPVGAPVRKRRRGRGINFCKIPGCNCGQFHPAAIVARKGINPSPRGKPRIH